MKKILTIAILVLLSSKLYARKNVAANSPTSKINAQKLYTLLAKRFDQANIPNILDMMMTNDENEGWSCLSTNGNYVGSRSNFLQFRIDENGLVENIGLNFFGRNFFLTQFGLEADIDRKIAGTGMITVKLTRTGEIVYKLEINSDDPRRSNKIEYGKCPQSLTKSEAAYLTEH